ncbi:hypothetical protein EV715DRAFT_255951 [Schizophyllum commune]
MSTITTITTSPTTTVPDIVITSPPLSPTGDANHPMAAAVFRRPSLVISGASATSLAPNPNQLVPSFARSRGVKMSLPLLDSNHKQEAHAPIPSKGALEPRAGALPRRKRSNPAAILNRGPCPIQAAA